MMVDKNVWNGGMGWQNIVQKLTCDERNEGKGRVKYIRIDFIFTLSQ